MGVPPTRFGGFPVTALSQTRLNFKCTVHLATSVVCRNRVDGNIEIPNGGTPQDVHVFNMAGPLEKSKEPIDRIQFSNVPGARKFRSVTCEKITRL